jgi:hypothetical protein
MKIHLPPPLSPVILAAPTRPMTADWMTELEAQVELTKAAQRRRTQERQRIASLKDDDEQHADTDRNDINARSARGKFDFLA